MNVLVNADHSLNALVKALVSTLGNTAVHTLGHYLVNTPVNALGVLLCILF